MPSDTKSRQLKRQSLWLKDSWKWLIESKGITTGKHSKALDVGCGPGYVMELMSEHFEVTGIDIDPETVEICQSKALDVRIADANDLPYEDDSFDVVYCTFLMLWVEEPRRVIAEMKRVSRDWILCLAEPDYGARIDYPESVSQLKDLFIEDLKSKGANPYSGRELRVHYIDNGMDAEIGVYQSSWSADRLRHEIDEELDLLGNVPDELITAIHKEIDSGRYFQYNPIFYALGRKTQGLENLSPHR